MARRMDLTLEQKADFVHGLIKEVRPDDGYVYALATNREDPDSGTARFVRVAGTPENRALLVTGSPIPDYLYEEFVYLYEDAELEGKVMAVFTGLAKLPELKDVMGYAYGATDAEALAQHIIAYLSTGNHPHESPS